MARNKKAEDHSKRGDQLAWVDGNEEAAIAEYRAALELDPDMAEAHWRIGQVHFHADSPRYEEARAEFSAAIRISPGWSEGHFCLANTLVGLNARDEAIREYENAARLAPDDSRIHISMGYCLVQMERFSEATVAYRTGIRLKPPYGEMDARMMLADAYKDNGEIGEAIKEWQRVLEMEPVWDYEIPHPEEARQMIEKYGSGC